MPPPVDPAKGLIDYGSVGLYCREASGTYMSERNTIDTDEFIVLLSSCTTRGCLSLHDQTRPSLSLFLELS